MNEIRQLLINTSPLRSSSRATPSLSGRPSSQGILNRTAFFCCPSVVYKINARVVCSRKVAPAFFLDWSKRRQFAHTNTKSWSRYGKLSALSGWRGLLLKASRQIEFVCFERFLFFSFASIWRTRCWSGFMARKLAEQVWQMAPDDCAWVEEVVDQSITWT